MRLKWFLVVIILINLGLLDSVYLAYHHYEINILAPETKSFCAINETIDCDKAATSIGSTLMGVPVVVIYGPKGGTGSTSISTNAPAAKISSS